MKKDYLPPTEGDLNTWETQFSGQIDAIATGLGVPAGDVTDVKDAIKEHQKAYNASIAADDAALSAKKTKNKAKTNAMKKVRDMAKRLKTAPGYTETMGNTLGIVGADSEFDEANAKPHLKTSNQGNNIVVDFNNPREVNGIKLMSKRGSEATYSFLATDTESPYVDTRPNLTPGLAEERKYCAYFFIDDAEVGKQSDEVSISITK